MPGKMALLALLALVPASAAISQVIEIDADGAATRYDQPMMFTASGAAPIAPSRAVQIVTGPAFAGGSLWSRLDAQALRHGLPPSLLRAVAWQESRGEASALSQKGARGVMQWMPATAAAMGVNPNDPDDNLRGGALYLRRQLDRFGNVPLALAAYNAGPGAVTRYGGVPPYRETRSYVASIMARWHVENASAPLPLFEVPSL